MLFRHFTAILLTLIVIVSLLLSGCNAASRDSLFLRLTDPALAGRMVGSEGNALAKQLLEETMGTMGLIPLAGQNSLLVPYEQGFLERGKEISFAAIQPDGTRELFVYGKDFNISIFLGTLDGTYLLTSSPADAGLKDKVFINLSNADISINTMLNNCAAYILKVDQIMFNSHGYDTAGKPEGAPTIIVTPDIYARLSTAETVELNVTMEDSVITAHNVVGVIQGKDSTKAVVLSAHFDGVGDQAGLALPCALDNASGTVAMMLAAQLLCEPQPETDIVICALNGEEAGLSGAYALVPILKQCYSELYNINIDCVGLPKTTFAMGNNYETSATLYEAMIDFLLTKDARLDVERPGAGDHWAFQAHDIPAVVLEDAFYDTLHIHSPEDTPNRVDENELGRLAEWIAEFVRMRPGEMYKPIHLDVPSLLPENDEDIPQLALDEVMFRGNRQYGAYASQLSYDELLSYFPDMPLLHTFMGNAFSMGTVSLMPSINFIPKDNEIIKIPVTPEHILSISLSYQGSDEPLPVHNVMIAPGNFSIRGMDVYKQELCNMPEQYVYIHSDTGVVMEVVERRDARSYCFNGPFIKTVDDARAFIKCEEVQTVIDALHTWLNP